MKDESLMKMRQGRKWFLHHGNTDHFVIARIVKAERCER
jgi:hypothetical protein